MAQKYKCNNCKLVVEVTSGVPDRREGGSCTKDAVGQHNWTKA
ncbi:MAG: hypothetical protein ABSB53_07805 [Nitrososphaerales archaeon]|jgi:hypothetical protein